MSFIYSPITQFATLETRRELVPKCVPQLILGSLQGTRWSAIGQVVSRFSLVPRAFPLKKNRAARPTQFFKGKAMGTRFVSFLPWEIKQLVLRASWRPQTSSLTSLTSAGCMRLVRSAREFYDIQLTVLNNKITIGINK